MEHLIWTIIIILFILSIVGIFVPIIPAVVLIWLGFILYHFFIDADQLNFLFWIIMIVFTIILVVSDIITNRYFVDKFGGSKESQWAAILGVILGAFIYPPFGLIIVPFIFVFGIEMFQHRTAKQASLIAVGALAGFLSGVVAKFLIQAMMIVWFFITVFVF